MLNRILTGILFLFLYGAGERLAGQEAADTLLTCPGTGPVRYSVVPDPGAGVVWQLPPQAIHIGHSAMGDTIQVQWLVNNGFYPLDVYQRGSNGCAGDVSRFVVEIRDTMPPWFSNCLSDIVLSNAIGQAWVNFTVPVPEADDNVGIERIEGPSPGNVQIAIGQRHFQFIAFDSIGLTDTCQWLVTVNDSEPPRFLDCPRDTTIFSDPGQNFGTLNWLVPRAIDNYGLLRTWSDFADPPQQFLIGITGINYFADDSAHNLAQCHFNVTVTDNQAPWFTHCPADTTVYVVYGGPEPVTWNEPLASDNNGNPEVTSNYNPGDSLSLGVTTITYLAKDSAGKQAGCSFDLTLADTTGLHWTNFPSDTVVYLEAESCYIPVSWPIPRTNRPAVINSEMLPDTLLTVGTYTVQYQAISFIGQVAERSFTITIIDTIGPYLEVHNHRIVLDSLTGTYTLRWEEVVSAKSDNCSSESVRLSKTNFTCQDVGTQIIEVTVTDNYGLSVTQSLLLEVEYYWPDVITASIDKDKICSGEEVTVTINYRLPANHTIESITSPGTTFEISHINGNNTSYIVRNSASTIGLSQFIVRPLVYGVCEVVPDTLIVMVSNPVSNLRYQPVNCNNPFSGEASVSPTGGFGMYFVSWYNGSSSTAINGLPTGLYWVDVTDSLGCKAQRDSFEIEPSTELQIELTATANTCFGLDNGRVAVNIINGTAPFSYLWNTGSTSGTIDNLAPGTYTALVQDAAGCRTLDSAVLVEPEPLRADVRSDTVWCYGLAEGTLHLSASGGTPPYFFEWQNESRDISGTTYLNQAPVALLGLYAGVYGYRLSDSKDCQLSDSFRIVENNPLNIEFEVVQPYCSQTSDGSITAHVFGNTKPFIYTWNTSSRDSVAANLSVGEYNLLVTDRYDCEVTGAVLLTPEFADCIDAPAAFSPNGDGNNDTWEIWVDNTRLLHEAYPTALVEVFDRSGNLLFKDSNGNAQPWDGRYKGRESADDSYFFIITLGETVLKMGTVTIIR